ncbi:MAG: molybdenum cofactor guanylyltransferase [Thermoanaerobaculia bacterium]|nr:molybdenum cofactor guanylyltransferase [Thermoanaerobaculia bacterium]
MSDPSEIVGVVLAGGRSSRFGSDKSEAELAGKTLAHRAAELLASATRRVLVADGGRGLLVEYPSIPDGPGEGPAAGILGAARLSPGASILALACDLPLVPESLLRALARSGEGDWIVPRWNGRLEPLCALYRPPALEALAGNVAREIVAPHRLIAHPALRIRFLDGQTLAAHGAPQEIFANINRPEDLERITRLLESDLASR